MLKAIQGMEICTAVDIHLPADEPPVRAQEIMVAEYIVVEIVQGPAADRAKIRDIILVQPGISHFMILAVARDKADLAHEFFLHDAVPESRVAGAKNSAQHAVARARTSPADACLALPPAKNAGLFRQRYGF